MKNFVVRLWKEEEGQDLIEYVLLVALIALLVAVGFPAVASAINSQFSKAVACMNAGFASGSC